MANFTVQTRLNLSNCEIFDLGLVDFQKAYDFQKKIFVQVNSGIIDSAIIICRHYPVITIGRGGLKEDILVADSELKKRNIKAVEVERGGKVTYHGPGQLSIYPIFSLNYFKKDIHLFLRWLEDLAIRILDSFDIAAERHQGFTGVWINGEKIASIGIAIKRWVTLHGLSINIKDEDLENFALIRPCGMDIIMTSIERVLNKKVMIEEVKETAFSIIGRSNETAAYGAIAT